jgi:hypothetical protein
MTIAGISISTFWDSKHYLHITHTLGPLAFNFVQLDLTWVAPSSSDKSQAYADANTIYERLLKAYKSGGPSCVTLDEHFDLLGNYDPNLPVMLKGSFPSHYAAATDSKSLSELHNDVALVDWESLGLEAAGYPFKSSFQQGSQGSLLLQSSWKYSIMLMLLYQLILWQNLGCSLRKLLPLPDQLILTTR